MKRLTTALILSLGLSAISLSVAAADFCTIEADSMMKNLNESTKARDGAILALRQQIDSLKAKNTVLMGVRNLKESYLDGIKQLDKSAADRKLDRASNLVEAASVIKDSLILSSLTLLMKEAPDLSKDEAFTLKGLCAHSNNAQTTLCKDHNNKSDPLNKVLKSFKEAYVRVKEKGELRGEVNKILNSIPRSLEPQLILDVLAKKSPVLKEIVAENFSNEEDLLTCFAGKKQDKANAVMDACEKLILDPSIKNKFQSILAAETKELSQTMKKEFGPIIDQANSSLTEEFNKTLNKPDFSEVDAKSFTLSKYKEIDQLAASLPSSSRHPYGVLLGLNDKDAEKFSNELKDSCEGDKDLNKCSELVKEAVHRAEANVNPADIKQINKAQEEINKILKDPAYAEVAKLKKYVGEKYLRSCRNENKPFISSAPLEKVDSNGCMSEQGIQLTQIKSLGHNVENIANTIFTETLDSKSDGIYAFNKAEIDSYKEICKGKTSEEFRLVCRSIGDETHSIKYNQVETDWKKVNKEYWVTRDQHGNQLRTKKKSELAIFAEGFVPVAVPMLVPAWLANMQMEQQIDYMTNAGMYNKQMIHNQDFFNNYYNGQWINGYGNPFDTYYMTNGAGYNFNPI